MADAARSDDGAHDHDQSEPAEGGPIPRVMVAELGYWGAGWDDVDGAPVIVVDKSVSEPDKARYVATATDLIRSEYARRRSRADAETAYTGPQ